MLDGRGQCKLTDLGLAKQVGTVFVRTKDGDCWRKPFIGAVATVQGV